jgi:hypothetical protein
MEFGGALEKRGRVLEDEFFRRVDDELTQQLKQKMTQEEKKASLRSVIGWADDELLENLIKTGITAETLVAMALVPMVQVAWADRQMAEAEKEAILKASEEHCPPESMGWQLLERWLNERPPKSLFETWKQYATMLVSSLTESQQEQLRHRVLQRTRSVAEAAGGFLGLMKVSAVEEQVLEEIEAALTPQV